MDPDSRQDWERIEVRKWSITPGGSRWLLTTQGGLVVDP